MTHPEMKDRVALITGAASGIGRASAIAFAAQGCKVMAVDIDATGGQETVRLIQNRFPQSGVASFYRCDVTDDAAVQQAVSHTVHVYGQLDYCHNNAGIEGERANLADSSTDNFTRVMTTNVSSVYFCLKHQLAHMDRAAAAAALPSHTGPPSHYAIVNTASTAGMGAFAGFSAYAASKHAVIGLTRTAAVEYAGRVRVNAVCPGTIATPMVERFEQKWPELQQKINSSYPIGRIGTPEEVADLVVFLCSKSAGFMVGSAVVVDGGGSL